MMTRELVLRGEVSARRAPVLALAAVVVALASEGAWTPPATNSIPPLAVSDLSKDPYRPQLRFTQRLGWANDPNGMIWWKGEWHFFHQHNPYGIAWGNMHWNHAVSKDLVHWTELGDALMPDSLGTMWSGSAVTDRDNTAGFGKGAQILLYTAKDRYMTQCLAYSTDGRTYKKYPGNPVFDNKSGAARDPRVFWHAPTKRWVMALYEQEKGCHAMWILASADLKTWKKVSSYIGGVNLKSSWLCECPGLEEVTIEGETGTAWVVWGADGVYAVGSFDGTIFTPHEEHIPSIVRGEGVYYAAQTYSDVPDGRTIWVAWYKLPYQNGSSYQHSFSLPQELTLRRTPKGLRLARRPVRELQALRNGAAVPFEKFDGELAEVSVSCRVAPNGVLALRLRGMDVVYDAAKGTLTAAGWAVPWALADGRLAFTAFIDRIGMEIFSADGLQMAPIPSAFPSPAATRLEVVRRDGVSDAAFTAWKLDSIYGGCASRLREAADSLRPNQNR